MGFLLGIYWWNIFFFKHHCLPHQGQKAHYGQVLHGLVKLLRKQYGSGWAEFVAIIDPAVLERVDLPKLLGYPPLMLIILNLVLHVPHSSKLLENI